MKQRDSALDKVTDAYEYRDYREAQRAMQSLVQGDHRRASRNPAASRQRDDRKQRDADERCPPAAVRPDERGIDLEGNVIMCTFEYSCFLAALAQKALDASVVPLLTQ